MITTQEPCTRCWLELGAQPPLHEHRYKAPARTALLLILGSSTMVEVIPAFFAAAKYGFRQLLAMAVVLGIERDRKLRFSMRLFPVGLQRMRLGTVETFW